MDLLPKKHKPFPIYLSVLIGTLIYVISEMSYNLSNTISLTYNPANPYKPPFDNIWLRILLREAMIWLIFSINIIALKISQLQRYNSLLLFVTILGDLATLSIALFRLKFDSEILFQVYTNTLGFLVSGLPYTIIVLLSLIPNKNLDETKRENINPEQD